MSYINKYATEQNDVAIAAGRTGQPHVYTAGGDYARGTITWSVIQTDTSTITLGGVYVKFTTAASDGTKAGTVGDPLLVNLKVSLTLTLDELVIVLNATANATIATCTYAKSGSTILTITKDARGSAGNSFALAASEGVVSAATLTTGTNDVAITLGTENIDLQLTDANDQYFILADAEEFTKKVIMLSAKSTGNAIITVANLDGSASVAVTLSTAGQYLVYQFLDGNWRSLIDVTSSAINALTPTDNNFIVGNGTTWVGESGATARTSLGFTAPILDAASPVAIGATAPAAGTFTTLTATGAVAMSPANLNVVMSPTGTGVVTINPATAGSMNNVVIGATTSVAGTFTTVAGTSVTVRAGGTFDADNGTATATTGAATLSKMAGIVTSESLTTAAAATYTLTLTNTLVTAASNILVTVGLGTATTGVPVVHKVTPGSGSVAIVIKNNDPAAALNGTILVQYMIVKP